MKVVKFLNKSLFLLVFLIGISGCIVITVSKPEPFQLKPLNFKEVCSGDLLGSEQNGLKASKVIIQTKQELNEYLERMPVVREMECSDKLGTTDFSQKDLILLVDDMRGASGFGYEVISVIENEELVEISYKRVIPGDVGGVVMTQPFAFILSDKITKEVRFVLVE